MKNTYKQIMMVLAVIALSAIPYDCFSKKLLTQFECQVCGKEYINIYLISDKDEFYLFVECTLNKTGVDADAVGFFVREKDYPKFISTLKEVKTKYKEWKQIAQQNNVKKLMKTMPIEYSVGTYFEENKQPHFDFESTLQFLFGVVSDPLSKVETMYPIILVASPSLFAIENPNYKGIYSLRLLNLSEFDRFLEAISLSNIQSALKENNVDDLFQ